MLIQYFQIFGKNDNHVPPEGRDLIRKTLHEKGVLFGFYEAAWAQRELILFFSFFFFADGAGADPE
jgi:hypothetical protein